MNNCALCFANGDERPSDVLNAGGVPLCFEHDASINEQARKPKPPRVVTFPRTADEEYLDRAILSALNGKSISPLADLSLPADTTPQ